MELKIKDKSADKAIRNFVLEIKKHAPEVAILGQLCHDENGDLCFRFGSFAKKEVGVIKAFIANRKNKDFDEEIFESVQQKVLTQNVERGQ